MTNNRKKCLEMVFNLQWRSRPGNGGNVMGMYDTPATTRNFETFKSYLLKNSGADGDVTVAFVTSETGKEWILESEPEFEVALCAFRLKAKLGEVIYLNVYEKIGGNSSKMMMRQPSNDVETQFDNAQNGSPDEPPQWFTNFMAGFKHDVREEIRNEIRNEMAKLMPPTPPAPPERAAPEIPSRQHKAKQETSKRSRRHLGEHNTEREVLKAQKYQHKYDSILEKLNAKTKKIKDKKMALCVTSFLPADGVTPESVKVVELHRHNNFPDYVSPQKHAINKTLPKMLKLHGGTYYMHNWVVENQGSVTWPENCFLKFTWGSAGFKPTSHEIEVPRVKPGEKTTIRIGLISPNEPGEYSSHWNLYYKDRRFGETLSLGVIIEPEVKFNPRATSKETTFPVKEEVPVETVEINNVHSDDAVERTIEKMTNDLVNLSVENVKIEEAEAMKYALINSKLDKSPNKYGIDEEDLIIDGPLNNCRMYDNVLLPPAISKQELLRKQAEIIEAMEGFKATAEDVDSAASGVDWKRTLQAGICASMLYPQLDHHDDNNNSQNADEPLNLSTNEVSDIESDDDSSFENLVHPPPRTDSSSMDERDDLGYVFVNVDGKQLSLPKKILREECLINAETAPNPQDVAANNPVVEEKPTSPHACLTSPLPPANFSYELPHMDERPANVSFEVLHMDERPANISYERPHMDERGAALEMSHCSAAGSCFSELNAFVDKNARYFVFPRGKPGYEVIQGEAVQLPEGDIPPQGFPIEVPTYDRENWPTLEEAKKDIENWPTLEEAHTSRPMSQSSTATYTSNPFPPVPNFQQDNRPNRNPLLRELLNKHAPPQQEGTSQTPTAPPSEPTGTPTTTTTTSTSPQSERYVPAAAAAPFTRSESTQHMPMENLMTGAVNVASSAINTARSVINMIVPQRVEPGRWVNGHWMIDDVESPRARNLTMLADMGFWNIDYNATLLARYNDDMGQVVSELLANNARYGRK